MASPVYSGRMMLTFAVGVLLYAVFTFIVLSIVRSARRRHDPIRINPLVAVPLALICSAVFSFLGIVALLKLAWPSPNESFPDWSIGILREVWRPHQIWLIAPVYLAWTGLQLIGSGLAGFVIGLSRFNRPVLAVFWIIGSWYLLLLVFRVINQPWWFFHDEDPWYIGYICDVVMYLISTALLIIASVFDTWLISRSSWFDGSRGQSGIA
ncbi:MAG TPA: hypothetical protein VNV43_05185 [Candidatus Acidoferrales bacterium]|jgi:hypothetical protein|nr:hypothetical protein [Candidatus Acidoferrales bacterium]